MTEKIQKQITVTRWTLLTWAGWTAGIIFIIGIGAIAETFGLGSDSGGQAIIGVGMGAGVGLMQWVALRNHLKSPFRWFWFSLIGFSVPYFCFDLVNSFITIDITADKALVFTTAIGGVLTGWLQYNYMLKGISPKAGRWVLYNGAAWLTAHLLFNSFFALNTHGLPRYIVIPLALIMMLVGGGGAPVLGIITGRAMVSILKNDNEPEK